VLKAMPNVRFVAAADVFRIPLLAGAMRVAP
jgi:1-acyl-sn-glycerol-3-phosphate acyltransferase